MENEITIILTSDEARALEKGLRELTSNTGAPEMAAQKRIMEKLEAAALASRER